MQPKCGGLQLMAPGKQSMAQCREVPQAEDTATFFGHLSAVSKLPVLLEPAAYSFLKWLSLYANPSAVAQRPQNKGAAHPHLMVLHLQT